jgi:transposase InsO family protein
VKKIRSSNGSKFKNLQVEEYLEEEGIKHEYSAPYTPQQNGEVERKNRTLIDMARTMCGGLLGLCFVAEGLLGRSNLRLKLFV